MAGPSLILGIESSCDETAAAVVRDGRDILSSVVASQHDIHAEYAGVVPELASRAHVERILPVVHEAVARAGVPLSALTAVAVGHRPGLIGSLLVGVSAAKALAWSLNIPLVGVDHVHAHLYAGMLGLPADAPHGFPALGLVVSGGHTSTYLLQSWTSLARLGATIDDALGEAYDKAATILGLPHPGGPNLDRLAGSDGANDRAFDLPISRIAPDSLDLSFSGLKTAVLYAARGVPQGNPHKPHAPAPELTPARKADLAASFQRAACKAVILKLERALQHARQSAGPVHTLLTGGGVTANSRLRAELAQFAQHHRLTLRVPPLHLCVDNAAMIAGLADRLLAAGLASDLTLQPTPTTAC